MLRGIFLENRIYGDEEEEFSCGELFDIVSDKLLNIETDLEIITKFLLKTTNFIDWLNETYDLEDSETSDDESTDNEQNEDIQIDEQVDMFNAQAEILKETQDKYEKLKKKYNTLIKKYKVLASNTSNQYDIGVAYLTLILL